MSLGTGHPWSPRCASCRLGNRSPASLPNIDGLGHPSCMYDYCWLQCLGLSAEFYQLRGDYIPDLFFPSHQLSQQPSESIIFRGTKLDHVFMVGVDADRIIAFKSG